MVLSKRRAGILLHPTSLPTPFGIGDLGPSAFRFVDFLVASGQSLWQVLPLVEPDIVGSPYASSSAFSGNWLLVSPELLIKNGLLPRSSRRWSELDKPVHYRQVAQRKRALFLSAYEVFRKRSNQKHQRSFRAFMQRERYWLRDAALFMALKEQFGPSIPWTRWPPTIRHRRPAAVRAWRRRLARSIQFHSFLQWLFDIQWRSLKRYANRRGVSIIGDLPLFMTRDSVDTWSDPKNFLLDRLGRPRLVAGVPPDYFSRRGQVWGDPLYNWQRMERERFRWWLRRFRRSFDWYDAVRLDHFRGYRAVWGVRAGSRTSRHGSWHAVPGKKLFTAVTRVFPKGSFIAEDLGEITHDVVNLRNELGFPGVRVAQFGFDNLGSVHALPNLSRRCVVYTGTHDNNTTRGWFSDDASRQQRNNVTKLLAATERTVSWKFIRSAYRSIANTVIIPLQDVLNLGSEARMNTPGTRTGNWVWRFQSTALTPKLGRRLRGLVRATRR